MKYTGKWIFYCNPKFYAIDEFLDSGNVYSIWKVTEYQKDYFDIGQKGIIRVGLDHRTKKELNGKKKLQRGIYAIVEIISKAKYTVDEEIYYSDEKNKKKEWRVGIKYLKNLKHTPVLLANLQSNEIFSEKSPLIKGRQNSSWPIEEKVFLKIIELSNFTSEEKIKNKLKSVFPFSIDEIVKIENKHKKETPEVREVISKRIERSNIAQNFKKLSGYKCAICCALNKNPLSFIKTNGCHYIETHHFYPVSMKLKGSLAFGNLMAVCANHHRHIHYGDCEIIESKENYFKIKLDGELLKIPKSVLFENIGNSYIKKSFHFLPIWQGVPIKDTYNNKPVLNYKNEPLFAELYALREYLKLGYEGVWVDTYRRTFRTELPEMKKEEIFLPSEIQNKLIEIHPNGKMSGTWDLLLWKENEIKFVELKRYKKDKLRLSQIKFLARCLELGYTNDNFELYEWTEDE